MIYFIGNEHGAIKIGYTADLDIRGRLKKLQAGSADRLTPLAYEDGTMADEGNLHLQFVNLRIRGEWFAAGDELLEYILSLPIVDKEDVQGWVATMLPKGNTADLQQLKNQADIDASNNVLDRANKQAQDVIRAAETRANRIIAEAERRHEQIIDWAASEIKKLIAGSCNPPLFDCLCCKCGRARFTVKERGDGFPWCDPCWVNHAIFDSGRFDAVVAQTNNDDVILSSV